MLAAEEGVLGPGLPGERVGGSRMHIRPMDTRTRITIQDILVMLGKAGNRAQRQPSQDTAWAEI